jgi:hypothetical protein
MKLLANVYVVVAALAFMVVTATGREEEKKTENVKALTILLFDADTKGITTGIKQIEIPEEKVVKKVRLVDAVGKPPQLEWPQLKRLLSLEGGTEITDPKREWVVKSVKMTLADDKVVECQVLSLRDTGKTTIKLDGPPESVKLIDINELGKLTSDKGKRTWYVYMAEYWETVVIPKREKP